MSETKKILLEELSEQAHPERVEDVIFWALDHYSKLPGNQTWGKIIAASIVSRIKEAEAVNEPNTATNE